jgi:hypothetical protein
MCFQVLTCPSILFGVCGTGFEVGTGETSYLQTQAPNGESRWKRKFPNSKLASPVNALELPGELQ